MAAPRGELIGGPLDGMRMGPGNRPNFIWVALAGRGVRVHEAPTGRRHLYRSVGRTNGTEAFVFAGHTHRLCECGGYNEIGEGERNPRCELCGAALQGQPA